MRSRKSILPQWKEEFLLGILPYEHVPHVEEKSEPEKDYVSNTRKAYLKWRKDMGLNPTQKAAYDNERARWILLHGERGTGKTRIAVHKAVDRAYLERNALVLFLTQTSTQAREGGVWDILLLKVLPEWKAKIGLEYIGPTQDPVTKKPAVWIRNQYGGGSKIVCLSMPADAVIEDRVKGLEPNFVVVDEAQNFRSEALFRAISQQVGRRSGMKRTQQIYFCCNPDGPSHPLYKRFWIYPVNEKTGEWNEDYARYYLPKEENLHNLPKDYYIYVKEAVRGDPIEEARMVRGEWVDRPKGRALFAGAFSRTLHVRGDASKGLGLLPVPGVIIRVGYDLGPAHSSIHFMQNVSTREKSLWLVFDEINTVGKYVPYKRLAQLVVQRMNYWESVLKQSEPNKAVVWEHISDSSAFTAYREDGSVDAMVIERASVDENGVPRIVLKGAPKGHGSVRERVRMLRDALLCEEILISDICKHTIEMLERLEAKKPDGDSDSAIDPSSGQYKHVLDSLTYPMMYVECRARHLTVGKVSVRPVDITCQRRVVAA